MTGKRLKKYVLIIIAYALLAAAFSFIGGDQLKEVKVETFWGENKGVVPEITLEDSVEQTFTSEMDLVDTIQVMVATYGRENKGYITLSIEDAATQNILLSKQVDVASLENNMFYTWKLETPISDVNGKEMRLRVESFCEPGEAITLYYGEKEDNNQNTLIHSGEEFPGRLTMKVSGKNFSLFGAYYWIWVLMVGMMILLYMIWSDYQESRGNITKGKLVVIIWKKYRFLIQQLVARDFKTKYKRSVLGYLWSFLNPLLTMLVQYVVFSTIFKSDIDNYPVYLLSGIILFNFFTDAVGQGLGAIVNNASLITKVYVPKYIYPVTKVVSTSINLFISIIPLLLVTVMTGVRITPAILLLPFVLLCLLLFCVGLVMMLSAAMVFFRDTQYLWGIVSMVWMYATPLFYPESIIPEHFRFIQMFNPLYHMIKFARIIFIDGVSPAPILYGTCLLSAIVMCVIGAFVFKKTQNKFILYI